MKTSELELEFERQLEQAQVIAWEQEWKFDSERRWRFDFAWPYQSRRIAVEVEGGTWAGGRHTRGSGYARDLEKYNAAALAGWVVLRFSADMVKDGTALEITRRALAS